MCTYISLSYQKLVINRMDTKGENDDRESPSKPTTGDRPKRDEWSEGAVDRLLDVYESKWVLRNRAKLKGHDWEEVAREVSSRANSTKSPKTPSQCKNKIESAKKRYRSESAAGSGSRWPLFSRLDRLVRGRIDEPTDAMLGDEKPLTATVRMSPSPETTGVAAPQAQPPAAQEDLDTGGNIKQPEGIKEAANLDESTSVSTFTEKEKKKKKKRRKEKRREFGEVMESIHWFAELALRAEQARMETMREVEKMRAEAEARRGELDLKRTEIIATTQLQIAEMLVRSGKKLEPSPTATSQR